MRPFISRDFKLSPLRFQFPYFRLSDEYSISRVLATLNVDGFSIQNLFTVGDILESLTVQFPVYR